MNETEHKLQRLADAGIEILPADLRTHFVCGRDGFVALVERTEAGFGNVGNPGLLTERGLAFLVWRGESAWFVAKGFEQAASGEQINDLRRFSADLQNALNG